MPVPKLPAWQVGDSVYALRVDPTTGLYRVHGEGRIVRIEGAVLHLESKAGPKTWGAHEWPAFRTREDGEAYVRERPAPQQYTGQMAQHVAVPRLECLRCERLKLGKDVTGLDHIPSCVWRGHGDPFYG